MYHKYLHRESNHTAIWYPKPIHADNANSLPNVYLSDHLSRNLFFLINSLKNKNQAFCSHVHLFPLSPFFHSLWSGFLVSVLSHPLLHSFTYHLHTYTLSFSAFMNLVPFASLPVPQHVNVSTSKPAPPCPMSLCCLSINCLC